MTKQEQIMKLIGKTVAVVVGVALLGAIGFGAFLGIRYLSDAFAGLDPQVASVTAIASVVALTSAWVIARGVRAASKSSQALALRDEKAATYQLFVDVWENLIQQPRGRGDRLPAELSDKLDLLERLLALYGATAVVERQTALRGLERSKGAQHPDVLAQIGEALVAIRKDLGSDTPRNAAFELERLLAPIV